MLDDDGYPSEEELTTIRDWQIDNMGDCEQLLAYVQDRWAYAEYFTVAKRRVRYFKVGNLQRQYFVSTLGWSGNESLIDAMHANHMFWMLTWWSHRRGGHYEFRVG